MGCFGSKDKLSKEDMDFLKSHTRYDETTIKEWYKGFKVILRFYAATSLTVCKDSKYAYLLPSTLNNKSQS